MALLIVGLILWVLAHLFKRIAPEARAKMGDPGKGGIAIVLVFSLVLIVIGYRSADDTAIFWNKTAAMTGINNLLMVFAVYLYAASGMKTRITAIIRHPQLTAVKTWAVAHLLVNGDLASIILFGAMLAWAVAEVIVINRATPAWLRPAKGPVVNDVIYVALSLVLFGAIVWVHTWMGYPPLG